MNLTEVYNNQQANSILIWIHMTGGLVREVTTYIGETVDSIKEKVFKYWDESNEIFDIEDDDDQIWNTKGERLWSYADWEEDRRNAMGDDYDFPSFLESDDDEEEANEAPPDFFNSLS